jgi:hypothetical protein
MNSLAVDESAYSAVSVCIHDGDIDLTLIELPSQWMHQGAGAKLPCGFSMI